MTREITAWDKKWYDETEFRNVKNLSGVDVVFEKKLHYSNITIHLEGIKTPPYFGYVPSESSVLIKGFSPEDNDGTEKDRNEKIVDAVAEARKHFDAVTSEQIDKLKEAFENYEKAVKKVYQVKNEIGKIQVVECQK